MKKESWRAMTFCIIIASLWKEGMADSLREYQWDAERQEIFTTEREEDYVNIREGNQKIVDLRKILQENYDLALQLAEKGAKEEEFLYLLQRINHIRMEIRKLEEKIREAQIKEIEEDSEGYGIWDAGDISLSQLVAEYGSQDFLYIIPNEMMGIKLHLSSSLMIPRSSFIPLLDGILHCNGIGIKKINPYAKQLFFLKQDLVAVSYVASTQKELELMDTYSRVAYIYAPSMGNVKQVFYFLERMRDPKLLFVGQAGDKIILVGLQKEIKTMLAMCEGIWDSQVNKVIKVIPLNKITYEEMEKILKAYFHRSSELPAAIRSPQSGGSGKGDGELSIFPLSKENSIVLVGNQDIVDRAEALLFDVDNQVHSPRELTIFWYFCNYADPIELSEVLEKTYDSLIHSQLEDGNETEREKTSENFNQKFPRLEDPSSLVGQGRFDVDGQPHHASRPYWGEPPLSPQPKERRSDSEKGKIGINFIPYTANGAVLMVIRKDVVPKIKELIKKLDTPQRMVEIEVLLCEKTHNQSSRSGINIFRLGSNALMKDAAGMSYDWADAPVRGIVEFFVSRTEKEKMPAFDLIYNFLLAQEDIRVTACPSVVAINHTPAKIAITDQISINSGVAPVDTSGNRVIFRESYERHEYGVTIQLTPTIHDSDGGGVDKRIYVTLETDIVFENVRRGIGTQDRPDIHKRSVKNQVRVEDGHPVILGGLRNKNSEDRNEKIPFLGEIPVFGKLFGTNVSSDLSNEMFIFIKPTVIRKDDDLFRIMEERLKDRPGDMEILIRKIQSSKQRKRGRIFQRSFQLLFDVD